MSDIRPARSPPRRTPSPFIEDDWPTIFSKVANQPCANDQLRKVSECLSQGAFRLMSVIGPLGLATAEAERREDRACIA